MIEVSGRLYPVEVRYRPLAAQERGRGGAGRRRRHPRCGGRARAASRAAATSWCSCPGEREIRETADALRGHRRRRARRSCRSTRRLSLEEQERVFHPGGARRIVLATNVAETSLTVPGIRYVVDTGLARVNRYSYRNKVEQLQIEPISQASANQRAGPLRARRGGRVHPALLGGRLPRPAPIHRPGDPALVARVGDPAHEGAGPDRRRALSRSSIRRRRA